MRSLRGAVADQHVAVRTMARADTIQEILNVVLVEVGRRPDNRGLHISPDWIELVARTVNPKPAQGTAELDRRSGHAGRQRGFKRSRKLRWVFQQHVDSVG